MAHYSRNFSSFLPSKYPHRSFYAEIEDYRIFYSADSVAESSADCAITEIGNFLFSTTLNHTLRIPQTGASSLYGPKSRFTLDLLLNKPNQETKAVGVGLKHLIESY